MKYLYILALTFCSLFLPITANAELEQSDINLLTGKEWLEIGGNSTSKFYVRPSSITEVRPLVYAVPVIHYVENPFNEHVEHGDVILMYNVFSCILRKSATLRYAHFSKEFELKSDYSWTEIKWKDVDKDTYESYVMKSLCQIKEY